MITGSFLETNRPPAAGYSPSTARVETPILRTVIGLAAAHNGHVSVLVCGLQHESPKTLSQLHLQIGVGDRQGRAVGLRHVVPVTFDRHVNVPLEPDVQLRTLDVAIQAVR